MKNMLRALLALGALAALYNCCTNGMEFGSFGAFILLAFAALVLPTSRGKNRE
jgi:hypothetical protein